MEPNPFNDIFLQNPLKNPKRLPVRTNSNTTFSSPVSPCRVINRSSKHNLRTAFNRKTVNTRADGRNPDAFQAVFVCDFQAVQRRLFEFFLLVPLLSLARADGMDDVPRLEIATAGDHCAADRTAADFIAFLLYGGAAFGAGWRRPLPAPNMSEEFAALTMASVSSSVMSPSASSRVLLFYLHLQV